MVTQLNITIVCGLFKVIAVTWLCGQVYTCPYNIQGIQIRKKPDNFLSGFPLLCYLELFQSFRTEIKHHLPMT